MKVLVLGPNQNLLLPLFTNDSVETTSEPLQPDSLSIKNFDFAISFGYRHMISQECIEIISGNILNIHISLLPWNKGSNPNIWSWLENSPKGVSVHWVTDQLDAGDIALQKEVSLDKNDTLSRTYEILQNEATELFNKLWNDIGIAGAKRSQQSGIGNMHRKSDLIEHQRSLTRGYETRCKELTDYGRENNLWLELN